MEDYSSLKGNSHKEREREKVKPVVKSPVKIKKKSGFRKVVDVFMANDVSDVRSYILLDVLVPAVRKVIYDVFAGSLKMALFGDSDVSKSSPASRISYQKYYDSGRTSTTRVARNRVGYDFDDIIIESKGEADDILACMDEMMANYHVVSVTDFYDLLGVESSHTDNKYGWNDIRNASIVRVGGGYVIKLPRALPLD